MMVFRPGISMPFRSEKWRILIGNAGFLAGRFDFFTGSLPIHAGDDDLSATAFPLVFWNDITSSHPDAVVTEYWKDYCRQNPTISDVFVQKRLSLGLHMRNAILDRGHNSEVAVTGQRHPVSSEIAVIRSDRTSEVRSTRQLPKRFKQIANTVFIWVIWLFFGLESMVVAAELGERRRPQFQTDFGYIVTPLPFILPGVGTGVGLLAGFNNVFKTPIDIFLVNIWGDVEGNIAGVTDIPLLHERWLLDVTSVAFNKGQQNRYLKRGMDSDRDDFNIVELSDSRLKGGRTILTFFERQLEFYLIGYAVDFKISAIRDNEGSLVSQIDDPEPIEALSTTWGTFIDYTDDRTDPKKGVRLQVERSGSPPRNKDAVDYFVMNYSLTGYVPVLAYSTLAFNYFRSDAHVVRPGNTDPENLKTDFGCFAPSIEQCDPAVQAVVADQIAQNTYGSAASLGGRSRLRSFVGDRFSGAHAEFFGTELRWNLTDEKTPFDLWIVKDLRTGFQLAFFHETGTVADQSVDLWKSRQSSSGVGARLITGSGFVYRLDVAYGDEGMTTTLFIDYPWGAL
jgi:hypothetical protein